jgi:multiple sugar transport system permease protein
LFLGFVIAVLFNREFVGKRIYSALMILPLTMSLVVVGLTARMGFNQSYGFVNQLLRIVLGRPINIDWFANKGTALAMFVIADIWRWTPFVFILFLSGLSSLPIEPYESAQIDGANKYQILRFITLPQMKYPILVAILLRFLELFRFFDIGMLTTRGGPGISTETISMYIYEMAFQYYELGFAAAGTFVLLVFISVAVMFFVRMLGQK